MLDRVTPRGARPSGRDLQRLFAATIVLPALLLGVVGVRAWLQDRRMAEQQLRERVDRAADLALRAFEADVREWQTLLEAVERRGVPTLDAPGGRLGGALAEPGAAALLVRNGDGPALWPATQAPYLLSPLPGTATPPPLPAPVQLAEDAETRDRDYPRAITLYEQALIRIGREGRATVLHRLARTLRKAGRPDDAIAIYRTLSASTDRIGPLPADLVARHELCVLLSGRASGADGQIALAFYADLVGGRWPLEQTRYLFYSESIRRLLGDAARAPEASKWYDIERRKVALAEAAAMVVTSTSSDAIDATGPVVIVRTAAAPRHALLLSKAWLASSLWPVTFEATRVAGFDARVLGPAGETLFTTTPDAGQTRPAVAAVTRQPDVPGLPWRLRVAPRDPDALMADARRWRTLNLVMLLTVVVVLGCGAYLTTRVLRRELEVARLQSDFVAAVSHEFRSPLTGIRQLGEMLLRGRVPDESRRLEYYERITRESDRLSRLVENLLDVAQIEAGRKEYRFESVDTSDWLRRVVEEARTNPAHRGVTIAATIPDALPRLTGDREALGSAVHNLLDNAVKYSPGADTVWCEAESHGGTITIRVRDTGVGISDDDRRVVFERFRRGGGPITQQVKGTGLGLSLVDHIVRAHGGRIECDSRLGEGTTFSIHLSAASPPTGP